MWSILDRIRYFIWPTPTLHNPRGPSPYGWYHPEKCWVDIIFTLIFPYIMPMDRLVKIKDKQASNKSTLTSLRQKTNKMEDILANKCVEMWGKVLGCRIATMTYGVPRSHSLLKDWNISTRVISVRSQPVGDIPVRIYYSELLTEVEGDLTKIPLDVPFVIAIHGGGFAFGTAHNDLILKVTSEVVRKFKKPVVLASIEYSLSPEYTFPTAIEEVLTCVDHFVTKLNRKVHITGMSAGATLANVACMEIFRRKKDKVATLMVMSPALDPACDSLSYYLNSSSWLSTAVERWCWQSYLDLPAVNTHSTNLQVDGSNRDAWNERKASLGELHRLINPCVDLPDGLDSSDAPRILVTTNRADPLYDDGVEFVEKLKQASASVIYLEHPGSHILGTLFSRQAEDELIQTWGDMMFTISA